MSPGFLQQPAVLSLYNKLGNEDTDSSYHPLTILLPSSYHPWPLLLVTCAAAKLPPPSSDTRHTHACPAVSWWHACQYYDSAAAPGLGCGRVIAV